jgi:titin
MIGGASTQIITGNNGIGVEITGASATGNTVAGNTIGLDASGTSVGNGIGVELDDGATGNTVGGTTAATRNIISGNTAAGVEIAAADKNFVAGNYIGVAPSGHAAAPNAVGVLIGAGAEMNNIGGASTGTNVISGNRGDGVDIQGAGTTGNTIQANLIGTDADGTGMLPNAIGVVIEQGATSNLVGGMGTPSNGALTGQGNVISGNTGSGVVIQNAGTHNNSVLSNFIGTDLSGMTALPNGGDGITIMAGVPANFIGGVDAGGTGPLAGPGNVISGNAGNGIQITGTGATGMQVEGNWIGTNAAGKGALPNAAAGVVITNGAAGNVIGGPGTNSGGALAGAGNLISRNSGGGIAISRGTTMGSNSNTIQGNFIGTDLTGMNPLGNAGDGIRIAESSANLIGGEAAGTGNLISGNAAGNGVLIIGPGTANPAVNPGANGNVVIGNLIGLSVTRTAALPNQGNGVEIENAAVGNLVGVDPQGNIEPNALSGNAAAGVLITGPHATMNLVQGNMIGTDVSGTNPFGNANGVVLAGGASANTIGGSAPIDRYVISGNTQTGVVLTDPGTSQNQVLSNLIGTEPDGTDRLANAGAGLIITNQASGNFIGAAGAEKVLSGNGGDGIQITSAETTNNSLFANMIGADIHGNPLANLGNGVTIQGASGNFIGGVFVTSSASVVGQGNTISNNAGSGVVVTGNATGDSILNNIIYENRDTGIAITNPVVSPPSLGVTIAGTAPEDDVQVSGKAGETFLVQFFSSDSRDNGFSQARSFLMSTVVTINSSGFFNIKLPDPAPDDTFVLATATDTSGNTSEFSMSSKPGSHTLGPGFQSSNLEEIKSLIKSQQVQGETASATIIISPTATATPAEVTSSALEPARKGKGKSGSKGGVHPTGTVIIDDGGMVLTEAKVKVMHGVSEAKVKLKFPTAGVQKLFIIYQPDAQSQQAGFNTSFTTATVTVTPSASKGKVARKAVVPFQLADTARPAGPRGLLGERHGGSTRRRA